MVNPKVITTVKKYLDLLFEEGLTITKAFIYGSQARGTASEESDIDVMLVSPLFDEDTDKFAPILWLTARKTSYKIEPIAVGEKRFQFDDVSPLIEIVRQEGVEIANTNRSQLLILLIIVILISFSLR